MRASAEDGRGWAGSQAIGLYYYGARYYDARQGQWISPDPILSKYLGGSGNGGAFNPINLSVYTQSYNNPIRYRDPNGQIPIDTLWDAANVVYDIGKIGVKRFSKKTQDAAEKQADSKCVFCGRETTRKPGPTQRNTDHAQPKSRGGNDTLDNAQNTCRDCNLDKRARTTEEYLRDKR